MKFLILALFAAVALGDELQKRICTPIPAIAIDKGKQDRWGNFYRKYVRKCAPWIHDDDCSSKSEGKCRMESVKVTRMPTPQQWKLNPSAEYSKGSAGKSCGTGMDITNLNECKRAVSALGINTHGQGAHSDSVRTFVFGCSIRHNQNNKIYFNGYVGGNARSSESPICRKTRIKHEGGRICKPIPDIAKDKGRNDRWGRYAGKWVTNCARLITDGDCSSKAEGRCVMESVSQDRETNLARLLNRLLEEELSKRWKAGCYWKENC